jgi:hypothetical protein
MNQEIKVEEWSTPAVEEIILSCEIATYMNAELPEEA